MKWKLLHRYHIISVWTSTIPAKNKINKPLGVQGVEEVLLVFMFVGLTTRILMLSNTMMGNKEPLCTETGVAAKNFKEFSRNASGNLWHHRDSI